MRPVCATRRQRIERAGVRPTIFRFARDFELAVSRFELAALGHLAGLRPLEAGDGVDDFRDPGLGMTAQGRLGSLATGATRGATAMQSPPPNEMWVVRHATLDNVATRRQFSYHFSQQGEPAWRPPRPPPALGR